MKCDEIRAQLGAYVEGELTAPERAAVAAHLDVCNACARRADAHAQMVSLLADLPREPAPVDLSARILAGVETQPAPATLHIRQAIVVAAGSVAAWILAAWLALQTALAAQVAGVGDLLALLSSRPETLIAYPQEAVYALLEATPLSGLVLTLGVALLALLLLRQALVIPGGVRTFSM